jgi:hypothetical protein
MNSPITINRKVVRFTQTTKIVDGGQTSSYIIPTQVTMTKSQAYSKMQIAFIKLMHVIQFGDGINSQAHLDAANVYNGARKILNNTYAHHSNC